MNSLSRHIEPLLPSSSGPTTYNLSASDAASAVSDAVSLRVVNRALVDAAVGASASDTFTRTITVGSGWGTADIGGTWVTYNSITTPSAANYGVNGSAGSMALNVAGAERTGLLPLAHADIDMYARFQHTDTPVGGNVNYRLMLRASDNQNGYVAAVNVDAANVALVNMNVRSGGTQGAALASDVSIGTVTVGAWYWIRARATGTLLQVKVWPDGTSEPASWTNSATDTTYASGLYLGVTGRANAGNTNLPTIYWDDFSVGSVDSVSSNRARALSDTMSAVSETAPTVRKSRSVAISDTISSVSETAPGIGKARAVAISDTASSVSEASPLRRVSRPLTDTASSLSESAPTVGKSRAVVLADTASSLAEATPRRAVQHALSDTASSVSATTPLRSVARPLTDTSVTMGDTPARGTRRALTDTASTIADSLRLLRTRSLYDRISDFGGWLSDDFNDNSFDTTTWEKQDYGNPANTIVEQNNRIEIRGTWDYPNIQSISRFHFQEATLTATLVADDFDYTIRRDAELQIIDPTTHHSVGIGVQAIDSATYHFYGTWYDGVGGDFSNDVTSPPTLPITFRIRETGGNTYWEYSLDGGANWTLLQSMATPVQIDRAVIRLFGGSDNGDPAFTPQASDTVAWDDLSYTSTRDTVARAPLRRLSDTASTVSDTLILMQRTTVVSDDDAGTWQVPPLYAKLDEGVPDDGDYIYSPQSPGFSDSFDDNNINPAMWSVFQVTSGDVVEQNQRLEINGGWDYASLGTVRYYTLTDAAATVVLTQDDFDVTAGRYASYWLENVSGDVLAFALYTTTGTNVGLDMSHRIQGNPNDVITHTFTSPPSLPFWMRIREASGTIYWEYSTDDITWTVGRSVSASGVGLTDVGMQMWIQAGSNQDQALAPMVAFDSVNFVPSGAKAKMTLGGMSTPTTSGYRMLRYRIGKDAPGGDKLQFTIRLYQGATLIGEWAQDAPDAPTTYAQTLTPAQEAAISDYNDLHVEVEAVLAGS